MENDAERFRQFAAECRRLAQYASVKNKPILLEIAAAWVSCADQEERKRMQASPRIAPM